MMNYDQIQELLPIGSVVMLNGAQKALMIYGVCQSKADTGEDFDYIGVLWPEGNVGAETQFLFNQADIQDVIFRGYEDESRDTFLQSLQAYYAKQK